MIDIRKASEAEMIWAFLNAEYKSDRFYKELSMYMQELQVPVEVVTGAFSDLAKENELRAKLLSRYRGYPDKYIFENYPAVTEWKLVALEEGDLEKLRYVDYDYWNELSNNTGKPTEGAINVLQDVEIFEVVNDGFYEGYKALQEGAKFPPMILLTGNEKKYLILEGHVRSTLYAMERGSEIGAPAYVGICDEKALIKKDKNMLK